MSNLAFQIQNKQQQVLAASLLTQNGQTVAALNYGPASNPNNVFYLLASNPGLNAALASAVVLPPFLVGNTGIYSDVPVYPVIPNNNQFFFLSYDTKPASNNQWLLVSVNSITSVDKLFSFSIFNSKGNTYNWNSKIPSSNVSLYNVSSIIKSSEYYFVQNGSVSKSQLVFGTPSCWNPTNGANPIGYCGAVVCPSTDFGGIGGNCIPCTAGLTGPSDGICQNNWIKNNPSSIAFGLRQENTNLIITYVASGTLFNLWAVPYDQISYNDVSVTSLSGNNAYSEKFFYVDLDPGESVMGLQKSYPIYVVVNNKKNYISVLGKAVSLTNKINNSVLLITPQLISNQNYLNIGSGDPTNGDYNISSNWFSNDIPTQDVLNDSVITIYNSNNLLNFNSGNLSFWGTYCQTGCPIAQVGNSNLTINSIAGNPLPPATVCTGNNCTPTNYSTGYTVTGGVAPYSWGVTGQPSGLTIVTNSQNTSQAALTGIVAATVPVATIFNVQVTVTDGNGDVQTSNFSLQTIAFGTIIFSPASGTALPTGTVGQQYLPTTINISGGSNCYSLGSTGLPPGIIAGITGGGCTGTTFGNTIILTSGPSGPSSVGNFTPTFTIVDSQNSNLTGTATYPLTVQSAGQVSITTTSLVAGSVGTPYTSTLTASGGDGTYIWGLTGGTLPPGINLNSSGQLTGTPTTEGSFNPIFFVSDTSTPPLTAQSTIELTISGGTGNTGGGGGGGSGGGESIFTKWWFWVIVVVALIIIAIILYFAFRPAKQTVTTTTVS